MTDTDMPQKGDRIKLVRTNDPYTKLVPGSEGTVTRWSQVARSLSVEWDDGSGLSLLPDEGDAWEVLS